MKAFYNPPTAVILMAFIFFTLPFTATLQTWAGQQEDQVVLPKTPLPTLPEIFLLLGMVSFIMIRLAR